MFTEMFVFKGGRAAEPEKFGFRWKGRGEPEQMLRSELWQLFWSRCGQQRTEGLVRRSGDSRSEIQNHGVTGPQTSHGGFAGEAGALWNMCALGPGHACRAGVTRTQTPLSKAETPA